MSATPQALGFAACYHRDARIFRNKHEFFINIYEPFMFIYDYSCSWVLNFFHKNGYRFAEILYLCTVKKKWS